MEIRLLSDHRKDLVAERFNSDACFARLAGTAPRG